MSKFRKKPVVIEAFQHRGSWSALVKWMESIGPGGFAFQPGTPPPVTVNGNGDVCIETLEGTMIANESDWIIQGVAGDLYPCKPDIFEQTYEPVT